MTDDPIAVVFAACRGRAPLPLWFAVKYGVGPDALRAAWADSADGYAMWDLFELVVEPDEDAIERTHDAVHLLDRVTALPTLCPRCSRWWTADARRATHQRDTAAALRAVLSDPGKTLAELLPQLEPRPPC